MIVLTSLSDFSRQSKVISETRDADGTRDIHHADGTREIRHADGGHDIHYPNGKIEWTCADEGNGKDSVTICPRNHAHTIQDYSETVDNADPKIHAQLPNAKDSEKKNATVLNQKYEEEEVPFLGSSDPKRGLNNGSAFKHRLLAILKRLAVCVD